VNKSVNLHYFYSCIHIFLFFLFFSTFFYFSVFFIFIFFGLGPAQPTWAGLDPARPGWVKEVEARVKLIHACMNIVKVIKLPSHCIWHLLNAEKGDLPVQRRTATKTMARWLFSFVSRCSSTVPWIFLYLQAQNGCFSVFLSFSVFLFPLWVVFRKEKKTFGPCFRTPLLWTKTTMLRILEPGVGWTWAFSGSLLCFYSGSVTLHVCSSLVFWVLLCVQFFVSVFKGFLVLLLGVFSSVLPQLRVWVLASPPSFSFVPPGFLPLFSPSVLSFFLLSC